MSENEMTFKEKLLHFLNPLWNCCVNQINKTIDATNLAENCLKTHNKGEPYSPILEDLTQDKGTQTDDIQESPKRKRAKFALQKYSEAFDDGDDDRSGKFSTHYSADISKIWLTSSDESLILETWSDPG